MNSVSESRISDLVVVRNAGANVGKALGSLASQHETNFEVVTADGVSTDSTLALARRVRELYANLVGKSEGGEYDLLSRNARAIASSRLSVEAMAICWVDFFDDVLALLRYRCTTAVSAPAVAKPQ